MNLTDISIKRPVLIIMVMVALVLFGCLAYTSMPLNITPAIDLPYVMVQITYPGASPTLIETQVSKKVEDAVAQISGIKEILSYSLENVSLVSLEFNIDKDPDTALLEVTSKVNNILKDLPDDAEEPIIYKVNINEQPIIQVLLVGDSAVISPAELYDLADKKVKNLFAQVDGVGQTPIYGGTEREIHVEFDNKVVTQNQISLVAVNSIIAASNLNLPAGYFQKDGQEFSVKFDGEFKTVDSLGDLEVPTGKGYKKLRDIAFVSDGHERAREGNTYFDYNNDIKYDSGVLIQIVKTSEGNAVDIQKEVEKIMASLHEELPDGVDMFMTSETASITEDTVNDTLSNIILGIVFTSVVLLFFLHSLRSSIIIAITMPLSVLPAFIAMKASGYTLNIMSLMGISTAVGAIVMNAVVILENIFRYKEMGKPGMIAASMGTKEIVIAVMASALTNIAVFLPLGTMSGVIGKFLMEFAISVVFTTVFSLFIAFTLTPMMAAYILPEKDDKKHPIGDRLENMFRKWENSYKNVLVKILKTKKRCMLIVAISFAAFLFSMYLFRFIPMEFMPAMDEDEIALEIELAKGSDLAETEKFVDMLEERLSIHSDLIVHGSASIGRLSQQETGVNMAKIYLNVIPKAKRKYNTVQLAGMITKELADIPGATIRVASATKVDLTQSPVDFYIKGPDMERLVMYSDTIMPKIQQIPGVMNLKSSNASGVPEITLYPDLKKISDAGITVQEIAMTMRTALEGVSMSEYNDNGEQYDIKVFLVDNTITSYEDIANISIATPAGILPMSHFANIVYTQGFGKILRSDREKVIEFTSDVAYGYATSDLTNQISEIINQLDFPFGYKYQLAGNSEDMVTTIKEMIFIFIIAIVLTYMLLAAILENFWQPVLILLTVPLAMIGIVAIFLICRTTMNFVGMMAIVMLVGMVVNNAILILDYTNQLRSDGMNMHDALIEACPTKLKAILMSNIATILGLLPMALGIGDSGAEMRQPMGIVSIGGLITSTILTLYVIPATQLLVSGKNSKMKNHSRDFEELMAADKAGANK